MSETDDTDDLLLIPPDFFSLESDLEPPYYNIVDNLIQQVSNLRNRITSIESTSDISLISSFLDNSVEYHRNMANVRKCISTDDLYQSQSTESTPQKPHTKMKLNSLPASPNVDRFSPRRRLRSPGKVSLLQKNDTRLSGDGKMLNEIDNFLSKVKTIQRINAVRNLENDFSSTDKKNSVGEIMDELDRQSEKLEAQIKAKENELVKEKTWRCGDNIESVPKYGAGLREFYNKPAPANENYQPMKSSSTDFASFTTADKSSDSSSDSTQLTAYNKYKFDVVGDRNNLLHSPVHSNAINALNMHKKLLDNSGNLNRHDGIKRERVPRGINTLSDNFGLMNLADIWDKTTQTTYGQCSKVEQKLQEEKLRRQHCEQLIQELQHRNLELQQKLAVAVKVDESKNNTIHQFQDALEKIAARMERLNKEKGSWEHEISKLKSQHMHEMDDASKKITYYEKEASKALNLAHNNQEKLSSLDNKCTDLQKELHLIEKKFRDVQENYSKEFEKNKQLSEILSRKEIELNENKIILNDARSEVAQSKRAVEVCQAELTSLKKECSKLQCELKDERNVIINLNEQKRQLLNEIQTHKNTQKQLQDEVNKLKKQLESNKLELRNFYQGQVEILVQNKLKEFQNQLDQAENNFKEDIKKREMSIAKTAAAHIQQISEKCSLEIKLLEEKHQEETRLHQIQTMQYKQEIETLQSKLSNLQEKRVQVAKQLQKIMESQWNEALRIITSGKTPSPFNEHGGFSTIDQLNSLKTKSYSNLEEVLSQHEDQNNVNFQRKTKDAYSFMQNFESVSDDDKNSNMETPVSSRPGKFSENEIQKYINLLLSRPVGNPTADSRNRTSDSQGKQTQNNDRASWQPSVRPRKPK